MFDALDADLARARALSFEAMNTQQQLVMLERCERFRRRIAAVEHPLINNLAHQATPAFLHRMEAAERAPATSQTGQARIG